MLTVCLWKVHLLYLLNLKAGHPSISVILASHSLTSVSVVSVWLQSTCYPEVTDTDGLILSTERYCCCDPGWLRKQGLMLPEIWESMLLTTDQPMLGKSRQSFTLKVEMMHAVVLCVLVYMCVWHCLCPCSELSLEHQNMSFWKTIISVLYTRRMQDIYLFPRAFSRQAL